MSRQFDARRKFIKEAMQAPYLKREEELFLATRWCDHQDKDALHQLVQSHTRLVIAIASKFRHFNLSMNDLIQEGHVGLLEAATRFEPAREVRFSTYATWWIRASMQDYILRNWSIVRGGTSSMQKALFFNLRRLRAKLQHNLAPISNEHMYHHIASVLGASVRDVALMDARLSSGDVSLDLSITDQDTTSTTNRMDFLASDDPLQDETVCQIIDGERRSKWLRYALGVLSERELRIVRERRLSDDTVTLEALGKKMGISKERVRQIENRALSKLKYILMRDYPEIAAFS